ncbi:hypothetical protein Patl1_15894 [Pistacia atlantica]|uniref:Uncharacterized protein n=1 Tax=Pistacia atlantica TaxID=434234 RepID=A0ACC1B866_9ROSI|nr:hypothetical protein Patl1_15894 [Pistacia atlantica]
MKAVVVALDVLQDVLPYEKKCLLMRLFTEKYYNKEAFKGMMRKVWRTVLGVRFRDLSPDLFLVEVENGRDKEKVR